MEYIEIKDNIIMGIYDGDIPEHKNPDIEYRIISGCNAFVGTDIRMYSDLQAGIKKPLSQLVEENLVAIPEGKKLNEAGTDFEDLTMQDKIANGSVVLADDERLEGEYIVKKTPQELFDEGKMSTEEHNAYIDMMRQSAYRQEADPLGFKMLRGEAEKAEWLEKIAEIKKRYPKK